MKSLQGMLDMGPGGSNYARSETEYGQPPIHNLAEKCYRDARIRANEFYEKDSRLPRPPVTATDPEGGLILIVQWCVEAERAVVSPKQNPDGRAGGTGSGDEAPLDHVRADLESGAEAALPKDEAERPQPANEPQAGGENGREKPWDAKEPGFILISKAREKYCDGPTAPTLAVLGRDHCRPDGGFDYMRKGQRCKVHEDQFAAYVDRQAWTKAAVAKAKAFIKASETPRTRQAKLKKTYDMHSADWNQ